MFYQDNKLHRQKEDFEFAKQIIYTLHDEIERKSAEHKAYTEQSMESFKQKEQALLHLNKQALELRKEMEKKSTEQNAYNEQLMESFKQKEQALLVANKQVLEHELGSKDVIIALLNGKIEKQVRY